MNNDTHLSMVLRDDMDLLLSKKGSLKEALETYAAHALGALALNEYNKANDYLQRLLICLRSNEDLIK